MAVDPSCITLDFSRDDALNDFTVQTLAERYFLPGETSPQQAFARAAAAFADDEAHAQRLYDYVSRGWFMFATPLLSNGGSTRGLPISCFLATVDDSLGGIFDHYKEVGFLSALGGGVGSYYGDLRSLGERTSKGSSSGGMIPFVAVDDRVILAVSQGDTRRGSHAIYLDIHHPEIEEFISIRKPTGGDANRRTTNLHNAINITDEFMIAVRDGTEFALRSPKTGEAIRMVNARDLFRQIIETRMQTGEPYLHFIDASNRALPKTQQALGLKVRQSNLCVASTTPILTRDGYRPIHTLSLTETTDVWNGEEWSAVQIAKTADSAELMRVHFADGDHLDCTPYHKFYQVDGTEVRAGELKAGMKLETCTQPATAPREGEETTPQTRALAYAGGWATFAGYEDLGRLSLTCPDRAGEGALRMLMGASTDAYYDQPAGFTTIKFDPASVVAGCAPTHLGHTRRLFWAAGALDAAGEWVTLDDGSEWLAIGTTDADLIRELRLCFQEAGLLSRVRYSDTMNVFMVPLNHAVKMKFAGLIQRDHPQFLDDAGRLKDFRKLALHPDVYETTVTDTHPLAWEDATYCATEPKRGRLLFNGYLTGNCSEITLPSGWDNFGKKRTAVCCLSSANAETFDEWKDDARFIEDLMRMLDNVLTQFIENAPVDMANAIYSATRERSVGLGLLGFRSYLQSKNVAMDSDEARTINMRIFRHLRTQANAASLKLGAERGEAPDMEGTGERFAHKLAVAPNASSSIIIPTPMGSGTSPSIEPDRANAYLHKTLSGSFPVKNPYLRRRLAELGKDSEEVWKSIVANEGSVQHLDFLDAHDKRVYQTAIEIPQEALVRLAADRTPEICQSQSLNIFIPANDVDAEDLVRIHYLGWELGLKSFYYLRSTTPKRAENTNTTVERRATSEHVETPPPEKPVEDEECFACQG